MFKKSGPRRKRVWWTRERVILGLQRFYADFQYCPTSSEEYAKRAQFSGEIVNGKWTTQGHKQKYPSFATVLNNFATFRDAWTAAGFVVDSGYQEWSPIEDWYIIESCGILPRVEVAETLKRTVPAVKRRLYDLGGISAHTRWGMTLSAAETYLSVPQSCIRRYLIHGTIPFFRGYKHIYLNPADLLEIKEFDWTRNDIDPHLESLIRKAQIQRVAKILKFGKDWRSHEVYTFQGNPALFTKRISARIPCSIKERALDQPNKLKTGDWVQLAFDNTLGVAGRVGIIRSVFWSPQICDRRDGTRRKCWMARVEFPRLRGSKIANDDRIRYGLPLDCLAAAEKPEITQKPLSDHPEAVRQRTRYDSKYRAEHKLSRTANMSTP